MPDLSTYLKSPTLLELKGSIQHYAWGGKDYIPQLTGFDNTSGEPCAEYWMGAHVKAPGQVKLGGTWIGLHELIQADPVAMLGKATAKQFNNLLPFLFKVLDVNQMLSIQAHPTREVAIKGYQEEEAAGIPLTAFERTFKDANHKPEVMVALTDFWLLHGFKQVKDIRAFLESDPLLTRFLPACDQGLAALYQQLMELPQEEVNAILHEYLKQFKSAFDLGQLDRSQPAYWAMQADRQYTQNGNYDRGIFSIFIMNLVQLQPGEGIFQDAGILHAYLEGVNVELMANSDNVFRGGLTPKYVDVPRLMDNLRFEPVVPKVLKGEAVGAVEWVYPCPAPDFLLSRIVVDENAAFQSAKTHGPAIVLILEGEANFVEGENQLHLEKGQCAFVPANVSYAIQSSNRAVLYQATVPIG